MATLHVHGVRDPTPGSSDLVRGLPASIVRSKGAVRVEGARAGVAPVAIDGLADDDIVEIELSDGLRLWSRVEDLERDFGIARSRSVADGTIEIPSELQIGGPSRGLGAWVIKALRVFSLKIEESIGRFVANRVESHLQPGPGLYRCSRTSATTLAPVKSLTGSGPTLVFLHGTGSSTSGTFEALWTANGGDAITQLFARYDGRLLSFQHETLTKSPIENASALAGELARLLKKGAEIHLVSHSRGGLIGELLARGMRSGSAPFTPDDLSLFSAANRTRDRKALDALNRTLQRAQFRIERFVRVACPARGTTLAGGRLDRYFSIFVNVASFIPGLRANPVYEGLTTLLAGVLKLRTRPDQLPGLEAMMPGSPLVQMLNRPDVITASPLHVIGGDLAGEGLFGRLETLATDLFFREDHDLVVNTPAMLGGTARTKPIRYWIDTGPEVTHFHYFQRSDTSRLTVAALTGHDDEFHTLEAKPFAVTVESYRKRAIVSMPVVFVLPGIMGSELSVDRRSIWVNRLALTFGGLSQLDINAKQVTPTGIVRSSYEELCDYLSATHEVVPFPYDWRRSIEDAGARLADALGEKLEQTERTGQPIRLLAHSMGGLVVRAMLATPTGQKIWARIAAHAGARFVMLGTPNGGSHAIPAMLIGRDALLKQLALLDLKHDYKGQLQTITAFEGVLNLLPHEGTLDLYSSGGWDRLARLDWPAARGLFSSTAASSKSAGFKWPRPSAAALTRIRRTRDLIRTSPLDTNRTIYVAGAASETACDLVVDDNARPGRRVRVLASAQGDGRVLWKTGIPPGIRTFYMDAVHGNMTSTKDAFPALLDLLTNGTTSKLATRPPPQRAAADEIFELRESSPTMLPDEQEIIASAMGGHRPPPGISEAPRVRVRVVHDNLKNAASPVLVGHYEHDLIVAAEKYLDSRLSNRLSELQRMELYPGPLETTVVVLNDDDPKAQPVHPGAIVVGLGTVGDLTPGSLMTTLAQGLTTYGAECVGHERRRRQRTHDGEPPASVVSAPVTALLVGSGEGGVTLTDAIQALLRAVLRANQRLALSGAGRSSALTARIDRVDIIELYEDRAIDAAHALRSLSRSAELRTFVIDDLLVSGPEGQRRVRGETAPEWYQRLRITSKSDGSLRFEALTQLARANAALRSTERQLVEKFVDGVIETTASNASLGFTLFELLVPNDFKVYAPDRRKLALLLDEDAAALPWELLQDRYDKGAPPLAVASGMIRQLLVEGGRARAARAPGSTALVIGNPIVGDPRFPSLQGAADEASAVAGRLTAAGYQVSSLIGSEATPIDVLTALHEKPWRVLHMAAHGVFQFTPARGGKPVSGLVLDDEIFLTAAEADQMRYVPELIFINCCHLGQTRGDRPRFHRLAANLATQFIRMGARAVIAAGWAVDDGAAKTFARTFYDEMFQGCAFGEAVTRARQQVYDTHGRTNTWGAYQCYGDAAFSLVQVVSSTSSDPPVAAAEVAIQAEQIAARARAADEQGRGWIRKELDDLLAVTPADWLMMPNVAAPVAAARGALGEPKQLMRSTRPRRTKRRIELRGR